MFTVNVEDQLDLLLETLVKSEVINNAIDDILQEDTPLDLSIKRERVNNDEAYFPSRSFSRSSSSSMICRISHYFPVFGNQKRVKACDLHANTSKRVEIHVFFELNMQITSRP